MYEHVRCVCFTTLHGGNFEPNRMDQIRSAWSGERDLHALPGFWNAGQRQHRGAVPLQLRVKGDLSGVLPQVPLSGENGKAHLPNAGGAHQRKGAAAGVGQAGRGIHRGLLHCREAKSFSPTTQIIPFPLPFRRRLETVLPATEDGAGRFFPRSLPNSGKAWTSSSRTAALFAFPIG